MSQSPSSTPSPAAPQPAATVVATAPKKAQRKTALLVIAGIVSIGAIAYSVYYALVLNHFETTDNAYVQGNVVQITPQVGGTVLAINAEDTNFVKAGQSLVKLDTADAQVALDQAEAALGQTVRQVRTLYTNNGALAAQITLREADIVRAQGDLAKAGDDLNRRQGLVANGAVSKEELNHALSQVASARTVVAASQAAAAAAREQLASNRAMTDGVSVEQHPSVQQAAAHVREAYLALKRSELKSPVDGYVAKRSVQLGQRVAAGAPLMSVIALDQLWVDANFKEVQLRNIRIGQPVKLVADLYGKKVEYDGSVIGLAAGTGSAFSLLPAQNATGNWIKVVQRVPVRVKLDSKQLLEHPLRVGLSMDVSVDISKQDGRALADSNTPPTPVASESVAAVDAAQADLQAEEAIVHRVINSNLGRPMMSKTSPSAARGPAKTASVDTKARRLTDGKRSEATSAATPYMAVAYGPDRAIAPDSTSR